jgi:hypothetical protein
MAVIGETDPTIVAEGVKKVIICCGQSYHSVNEQRNL